MTTSFRQSLSFFYTRPFWLFDLVWLGLVYWSTEGNILLGSEGLHTGHYYRVLMILKSLLRRVLDIGTRKTQNMEGTDHQDFNFKLNVMINDYCLITRW